MEPLTVDNLIDLIGEREHSERGEVRDDGLMYCNGCGKPLQIKKEIMGKEYILPVACDCDKARIERENKENEQKKFESRLRMCYGSHYNKLIHCRFDKDAGFYPNISKALKKYADCFGYYLSGGMEEEGAPKGHGILFFGPTSTGKTFAACEIANQIMKYGYSALYLRASDIADDEISMEDITSKHLLILDDLGSERQTSYGQEQVYRVIDARVTNQLPMIVTTNLTQEEITKTPDIYHARIYDRILEVCTPIKLDSINIRHRKFAEKNERNKEFLGL